MVPDESPKVCPKQNPTNHLAVIEKPSEETMPCIHISLG